MSARSHRFTKTCDITRPPLAGQTGTQVVATAHPCTTVYPASKETRRMPGLDTIINLFEMSCTATLTISDNCKLVSNGRTFNIVRAQRWEPTSPRRKPFYMLYIQEIIN